VKIPNIKTILNGQPRKATVRVDQGLRGDLMIATARVAEAMRKVESAQATLTAVLADMNPRAAACDPTSELGRELDQFTLHVGRAESALSIACAKMPDQAWIVRLFGLQPAPARPAVTMPEMACAEA
jgi:hypothetical protein